MRDAVYTMTLQECLQMKNLNLFEEQKIDFYPSLINAITDNFLEREIAYDSPYLFKLKLNYKLRLYADNYNKMLRTQMIEYDPFITDYIEESGSECFNREELEKEIKAFNEKQDVFNAGATEGTSSGKTTGTLEATTAQENAKTGVNARLLSEAENKAFDRKLSETQDYGEDVDGTEHTETTSKDVDTRKTETETQENQTARAWTEKGSSNGHALDVHSDTPQAMLFNDPNVAYGTGRQHYEGKIKKDAEGNDYLEHFAESNPSTFDSAQYDIGSSESPWFNYASSADNKISHDSYNKEGTETYSKNSNGREQATGTVDKNGDTSTESYKGTTGNKDTNSEENSLDSRALNLNEHTKDDSTEKLSYKGTETNAGTSDTNYSESNRTSGQSNRDNVSKGDRKLSGSGGTKTNAVRKGRTAKSPAELLTLYRDTLTFNADKWMIDMLEPLFLQVF